MTTAATGAQPQSGIRKWIHDRLEKFKAAWQDAGSGALYWMRRAWDWLHTLVRPDEAMLARLWSARRIKLHHPAARSEVDVRANWRNYLDRQWRRHLFWLVFNAVITPPSVILAVLPGPNLIGFWFAYRAIHHVIVVWGITRAQRNLVPTELHPLESLDLPIEHDDDGKARHAALPDVRRAARQARGLVARLVLRDAAKRPAARSRAAPPEPAHAITSPKKPETGDHAPSEL